MIWDKISRAGQPRHDPIRRDPLSVGVAFLVNIGYAGAISGIGATIVGSAIIGAIGLGLSLLSSAIFSRPPQQHDPQQRQVTVRQSIGPRVRYYGRVKVGGLLWFFESKGEYLYKAITLNEGRIAGISEFWLNDQVVTLDGNGDVNEYPYRPDDTPVVNIQWRDGSSTQPAHGVLVNAFPGVVTDAHRLRGIANALTVFREVSSDKIAEVYPQLDPQFRAVIEASIVKSVRSGVYGWSENPVDAIWDYLTGYDDAGYARGAGFSETVMDVPSWISYANMCDQPSPIKAGGTIKRYRLWGGYNYNEKMKEVLPRMLDTCDGDIYLNSDGKMSIRGGEWVAPNLTLDAAQGHIIDFEMSQGRGALAAFNELTVTYMEPNLDYQEAEAQVWVDRDNIDLIGRPETARLDLQMVPHHAQARRLAKIHTHKENPEWQGRIVTNLYGFNAINEHMVHIKLDVLGIDDDFLIRRLQILPDMTGVEIHVTSLSESAYAWDPALEEGNAPGQPPDTSSPSDLPPPDDFAVTVKERSVSGSVVGLYIEATWTEPDREALSQQVQYRISPAGDWFNMSVSDGVGLAESGLVNEGDDYDTRIRTRSPAGASGDWSPIITVNASV